MFWKTCQCPEDLFARLNKKYDFAKVMDINCTHRGLFQYICLPNILKQTIDLLLTDIHNTTYLADIIVILCLT